MTTSGMLSRVVHVSADYPDPIVGDKTHAIRRLVHLTRDRFDHFVISLNRISPSAAGLFQTRFRAAPFEDGIAATYEAPPLGLGHLAALRRLGTIIAQEVASHEEAPSLLVGHKLTVEGIAVATAAAELRIPYAITVQGNTDCKILAVRPDLRGALRRVWREAAAVFAFAPWALRQVEGYLGPPECSPRLIPCPLASDAMLPPVTSDGTFVSVFRLDTWRTKNFDRLVAAQRSLARAGNAAPLAIVGGGSEDALETCRTIARGTPGISFQGHLPQDALAARLNRAAAMVLPSRRESFGMVFLEALFAGSPIIYPSGTAVDGYFDDARFALRVDASSPSAIAAAMLRAIEQERDMKAALERWQNSGQPTRFMRPAIAADFSAGLEEALAR